MATQTQTKSAQGLSTEQNPDVPGLVRRRAGARQKALENALHELKSQASDLPPPVESAGRVGARLGKVSELTIIVPLAPGGAKRLARVPAGCWGQPLARRGQGRHPPHDALRVLRQRHAAALRHGL